MEIKELQKEIRVIDTQLSKHRKLLCRSVSNRILPQINYHHYEIVQLIGQREVLDRKQMDLIRDGGLLGVGDPNLMAKMFQDLEDHYILTGKIKSEE